MFLDTAKRHFEEDIVRANGLVVHANAQPVGHLKDDLLRSGLMMAVGATDAYFCDAYADLITRTLRAKDRQPTVGLPNRINTLRVPVAAVIRNSESWRWRMAAREMIEKESVLSINKVRDLFNHFFRKNHKILSTETIGDWLLHKKALVRLFGISKTDFRACSGATLTAAKKAARKQFIERMDKIFQRRHDCIHNCDRPKIAVQRIGYETTVKQIKDIVFLVDRCNDALLIEFPIYLRDIGFNGTTRARVTQ